eukprot:XP_011435857.1 PREDICTED: uncharacterized protein LOC105334194 [Crassostrea gigas]
MGGSTSKQTDKPKSTPLNREQETKRNSDHGDKRHSANSNQTASSAVTPIPIHRPNPFPPTTRKKDVLDKELLRGAKKNAFQEILLNDMASYQILISLLTKGLKDDIEKTWVLFLWVTNLDVNNKNVTKGGIKNTPKGDLKDVQSGTLHIADFYTTLCSHAGLKSVTIEGLQKDDSFTINGTEKNLVKEKWNAVFLKDSWRLIHIGLGKACNPKWKLLYFLIDPEDLIQWCFPYEHEWQLLSKPLAKHDFFNQPNCKRKCFEMGVQILNPTLGKVRIDNGRFSVEVLIDKTHSQSSDTMLDFKLRGKKMQNGINEFDHETSGTFNTGNETRSTMKPSNVTGNKSRHTDNTDNANGNSESPLDLKKYVFMHRADSRIVFDVHFPTPGTYVLDIEGKTFSTKGGHSSMSVICQFKFFCNRSIQEEDYVPLPIVPDIGFGPTPYCLRYGVRPVSHGYGHIVILPGEPVKIRFEYDGNYEFKTETISVLRVSQSKKKNFSTCTVMPNKLHVDVNVPDEGHYILMVHAKRDKEEEFVNIINYIMIFDRKNSNVELFHKRMMREKLLSAVQNGTEEELKEALENFKFYRVPDLGEVQKANQRLEYFETKRELGVAMQRRNIRVLETAIHNAKNLPDMKQIKEDIRRAENLMNRLKNQHPISKLEHSTLSEIRRYTNPSQAVKDVLSATYILLGHDIEYAKNWEYIQSQLTKTGRDSLQHLVLHCDVETVSSSSAEIAHQLLNPHDEKALREASAGAGAIFHWASQIVKDKIKKFEKEESIENEVSKGSKRSEKANSVQNKQGKASSEKDISTNGKSVDQKTGKVTAEEVEEEKEVDEISTRSTAKSGTLSLKSIHAKVGSFRKKGDKAMVFNKYNEQVYFEQSPPERFFWPKHF